MSKKQWLTIDHGTSIDVTPYEDARQHGFGDECWCDPIVEQTEGVPLITHNLHQHTFGDWKDTEPITVRGKQKIMSFKCCVECLAFQSRIGTVK